MTNFQSFAGGAVWAAVAAVLMLVALEPVSVEHESGAPTHVAKAPSAGETAAV